MSNNGNEIDLTFIGEGSGDSGEPILEGIVCGVVSLGCAKNLVDTESMLGLLVAAGAHVTSEPAEADVLIVNTCGFLDSAKKESIDTILELSGYKEAHKCRSLVVTGCLAQRYSEELHTELPEVDAIVGTDQISRIVNIIAESLDGERQVETEARNYLYDFPIPRLISTGKGWAYIKIAEGCDNRCSYCAIPSIRGGYRSRRMESIVEEAKALAEQGTKEIILIAQDTTRYGEDNYGKPMLSELLRRLDVVDGLVWIRVLYMYPNRITDELLETFAISQKLCHYFDIPLQHVDPGILRAMNRKGSPGATLDLIGKIRAKVPDAVIRTTFIVGFPGETDDQFESLVSVIKEARFDRMGVFRYSREEGTPAAELAEQISDRIKGQRYNRLMSIQKKISKDINALRLGQECDVLLEGIENGKAYPYFGRSRAEAPDVDGKIRFSAGDAGADSIEHLNEGDMIRVKLVKAGSYDIYAEVTEG